MSETLESLRKIQQPTVIPTVGLSDDSPDANRKSVALAREQGILRCVQLIAHIMCIL